jgi:hypothetical protein
MGKARPCCINLRISRTFPLLPEFKLQLGAAQTARSAALPDLVPIELVGTRCHGLARSSFLAQSFETFQQIRD